MSALQPVACNSPKIGYWSCSQNHGKMVHMYAEAEVERLSESDLREMPLHDAVLLDPVRGWRIWESEFNRDDYDESSEA